MPQLHTVAALLTAGCASAAAANPTFQNGALNGPVAFSSIPTSWENYNNGTTDTVDADGHPFGGSFGGIGDWPYAPSTNGGTWAWCADFNGASTPGIPEGLRQSVSGFTPGESYTIGFEFTNLGLYNEQGTIAQSAFFAQSYNSAGRWLVLVDGVQVGATPVADFSFVFGMQQWQPFSLDFTATAATHEITLAADWASGNGSHVGMGIDGLTLTVVPAPGALALLSIGSLAAARRRRR